MMGQCQPFKKAQNNNGEEKKVSGSQGKRVSSSKSRTTGNIFRSLRKKSKNTVDVDQSETKALIKPSSQRPLVSSPLMTVTPLTDDLEAREELLHPATELKTVDDNSAVPGLVETDASLTASLQQQLALQAEQNATLHKIRHEENNLEQSISANLDAVYNGILEEIARLKTFKDTLQGLDTSFLETSIENLEMYRIKLSCAMISRAYIKIIENDLLLPNSKITFSLIASLNDIFFTFSQECHGRITLEKQGLLLTEDEYIVSGDQAALLYAFVNIVKNAIKFIVKSNGKITVSLARDQENFVVQVTDNGMGMTPDQAAHCLDENRKKYNSNIQGSGSGLANVKKKLQKASGDVTVQSTKGKGSTFTITIPLEIVEIVRYVIEYGLTYALAVDDDEKNQKMLKKVLMMIGIPEEHIATAGSAEQAADLYKQAYLSGDPCNFVVTDLNMPEGNEGLALVRSIRTFELEQKTAVPSYIVIVSGAIEVDEATKKMASQYNGYVAKPCDKKKLLPLLIPTASKITNKERKKRIHEFFSDHFGGIKGKDPIISLISEYDEQGVRPHKKP